MDWLLAEAHARQESLRMLATRTRDVPRPGPVRRGAGLALIAIGHRLVAHGHVGDNAGISARR